MFWFPRLVEDSADAVLCDHPFLRRQASPGCAGEQCGSSTGGHAAAIFQLVQSNASWHFLAVPMEWHIVVLSEVYVFLSLQGSDETMSTTVGPLKFRGTCEATAGSST